MQISGHYHFRAAPPVIWELLLSPPALAKAIPGVQSIKPIPNEALTWEIASAIQAPGVAGTYSGILRMTDLVPQQSYTLRVSGTDSASHVQASAAVRFVATADLPIHTHIHWEGAATISGKLASIHWRFLKVAVDVLLFQFFSALARQLPKPEKR